MPFGASFCAESQWLFLPTAKSWRPVHSQTSLARYFGGICSWSASHFFQASPRPMSLYTRLDLKVDEQAKILESRVSAFEVLAVSCLLL